MKQVAKSEEIRYKCDLCGREFVAGKRRARPWFCQNCAEIARLLRNWRKKGIWVEKNRS